MNLTINVRSVVTFLILLTLTNCKTTTYIRMHNCSGVDVEVVSQHSGDKFKLRNGGFKRLPHTKGVVCVSAAQKTVKSSIDVLAPNVFKLRQVHDRICFPYILFRASVQPDLTVTFDQK